MSSNSYHSSNKSGVQPPGRNNSYSGSGYSYTGKTTQPSNPSNLKQKHSSGHSHPGVTSGVIGGSGSGGGGGGESVSRGVIDKPGQGRTGPQNIHHVAVESKSGYAPRAAAGVAAVGGPAIQQRQFVNNVPNNIETLPTRIRQIRCLPPQYCPPPFGSYPTPQCYPPGPCYPTQCYPPPNPYCPNPCYPPNLYGNPCYPPPPQPCYTPYPCPYPCMPPRQCCPPPPCPPPPCCPRPRFGGGRRGGGCCGTGSTLICLPRGSQQPSCAPSSFFPPGISPVPAPAPEQPASFNNCNFYCSELPKGFAGAKNANMCQPECSPDECDNEVVEPYPLNIPAGDDKVVPPPVGYPGSNRKIDYDNQIPTGNAYRNVENVPKKREPSWLKEIPVKREPLWEEEIPVKREPSWEEEIPVKREPSWEEEIPVKREPPRLVNVPAKQEPSRLERVPSVKNVREPKPVYLSKKPEPQILRTPSPEVDAYKRGRKIFESPTNINIYGKTDNSIRAMKLDAALTHKPGAAYQGNCNIAEEICVDDYMVGRRDLGGGPLIGGGMLGYAGGKPRQHGQAGYCIEQDYGCHPGQTKPRLSKWKRKQQCVPKRGRRLKTLCEKCHQRYVANNNHCGLPMPAPPRDHHYPESGKSTRTDYHDRDRSKKMDPSLQSLESDESSQSVDRRTDSSENKLLERKPSPRIQHPKHSPKQRVLNRNPSPIIYHSKDSPEQDLVKYNPSPNIYHRRDSPEQKFVKPDPGPIIYHSRDSPEQKLVNPNPSPNIYHSRDSPEQKLVKPDPGPIIYHSRDSPEQKLVNPNPSPNIYHSRDSPEQKLVKPDPSPIINHSRDSPEQKLVNPNPSPIIYHITDSTEHKSAKPSHHNENTLIFGPKSTEKAVVPTGFSHTSSIRPGTSVEVLAPGGSVRISRPNTGAGTSTGTGTSTRGHISLSNLPSRGGESRTNVKKELTAEGTKITVRMPHPTSATQYNSSFHQLYSNSRTTTASSQMIQNPEYAIPIQPNSAVISRSAPLVEQSEVIHSNQAVIVPPSPQPQAQPRAQPRAQPQLQPQPRPQPQPQPRPQPQPKPQPKLQPPPHPTRSLGHIPHTHTTVDHCVPPVQRPIFSLFPPLCPIRENKASILRKQPVANCDWHDRVQYEDVCLMPLLAGSPGGQGAMLIQTEQQFTLPTKIIQTSRDEISKIIIHKDKATKEQHIKVIKKHIPHTETVINTPVSPQTPRSPVPTSSRLAPTQPNIQQDPTVAVQMNNSIDQRSVTLSPQAPGSAPSNYDDFGGSIQNYGHLLAMQEQIRGLEQPQAYANSSQNPYYYSHISQPVQMDPIFQPQTRFHIVQICPQEQMPSTCQQETPSLMEDYPPYKQEECLPIPSPHAPSAPPALPVSPAPNHRTYSLPVEPPEETQQTVEIPEQRQQPVETPEQTQQPVEIPEQRQQPVETPEQTQQPVEIPEQRQQPVEIPEQRQLPVEIPEQRQQPVEIPEQTQPVKTPELPQQRVIPIPAPVVSLPPTPPQYIIPSESKQQERVYVEDKNPILSTGHIHHFPPSMSRTHQSPRQEKKIMIEASTQILHPPPIINQYKQPQPVESLLSFTPKPNTIPTPECRPKKKACSKPKRSKVCRNNFSRGRSTPYPLSPDACGSPASFYPVNTRGMHNIPMERNVGLHYRDQCTPVITPPVEFCNTTPKYVSRKRKTKRC